MIIYTAIFGNYDDLKEPQVITPGWKYYCFTDQPLKSKVWEIIPVKTKPGEERILSKHYKICPHHFFNYDHCIWIDASFIINCDLNSFFWEKLQKATTFMQHPFRNCVYQEAKACKENQLDDAQVINDQVSRYVEQGLPENNGMASTGVILRHNTTFTRRFCEMWWKELKSGSVRDQISWAWPWFKTTGASVVPWDYRTATEFLHVPHLNKPEKRKSRLAYYKKHKLIK